MNCVACHAKDVGAERSDEDSVVQILGLISSDPPALLARMLGGLCDHHRREVEQLAKEWQQEGLDER